MYSNKKVQEVLQTFTSKIKDILDQEIKEKKHLINRYLRHIRAPD